MREIELNFNDFQDRKAVHEYLKSGLGFPDYYGMNLDALHDVLTDISEDTCVHVIPSYQDFERGFIAVLRDAAEECRHFFVTVGEEKLSREAAGEKSPAAEYDIRGMKAARLNRRTSRLSALRNRKN